MISRFLPPPLKFAAFSFAIIFAASAYADYGKICAASITEYCGDIQPGKGRLTDCMVRNQGLLPPLCRTAVHVAIEQRHGVSKDCSQEISLWCPGLKPGKGRLYACLRFNEEQLSSRCQKRLSFSDKPASEQ